MPVTPVIVEISFTLAMSGKEYEHSIATLAQAVADVAGLQWKIWLLSRSTHEARGISLFEDEEFAAAFVHGPLLAQVRSSPSITSLRVAQFNILNSLTMITRGPITWPKVGAGWASSM